MTPQTRIPLEGGACVLLEGAVGLEGPVKASATCHLQVVTFWRSGHA
ncbi:hypothetical protein J7E97_10935 [Streptomyces sp. ISL-66]|nr:hypothetical protein [Streptomyces sp. ISL-66]MBT2468379.1 hypothetical protein [Streptomyces sp. ISL-66]